jgi:hypothetical protein
MERLNKLNQQLSKLIGEKLKIEGEIRQEEMKLMEEKSGLKIGEIYRDTKKEREWKFLELKTFYEDSMRILIGWKTDFGYEALEEISVRYKDIKAQQ